MNSRHYPQAWSLRPEELLIESARNRFAASVVIDNAHSPRAHTRCLPLNRAARMLLAARRAVGTRLDRRAKPWHRATSPSGYNS